MSGFLATLRGIGFPAIVGAVIFASAGRWDLPMVWAVLGVVTCFSFALLLVTDPGMQRERQAPGAGNRDRLTQPLSAILLPGHWVLAGLDVGRFHWSLIPLELQLAGLVGYAAATGVVVWAMRENRFYSSVVRVQTDREHHPIMGGPYRYVRHPGYAATIAAVLCGGLALGSWVALLPVLGFVALFVRRTLVEDRLLRQELPGYAEYAQQVRYRLLVGIF